jgi:hypothetical protein
MIGAEANRLDREKTFFFIKEMMIFFKNLYNEEEKGEDETREKREENDAVLWFWFSLVILCFFNHICIVGRNGFLLSGCWFCAVFTGLSIARPLLLLSSSVF